MSSVIVYIGSFDPFHFGHLEVALKSIEIFLKECKCLVFLPNNPRKGKPNRSGLHQRVYFMSFLFPLYNNQDWIEEPDYIPDHKMVVDTCPADNVLEKLKQRKLKIVGVCGSDIVLSGKQPKWKPDEWIIFERDSHKLSKRHFFYNVPCRFIGLEKTKYQNLSSTDIRNGKVALKNVLPKEILKHYFGYNPKKLGFSKDQNWIENDCFVKQIISKKLFLKRVEKINLWQKYVPQDIIKSPKIIKVDRIQSKVHLEYLKDFKTLWNMTNNQNIEKYLIKFFKVLSTIHNLDIPIVHGDMNPSNILCNTKSIQLAICDFGKTRRKTSKLDNLREWYQFWGSVEYFSCLYGTTKKKIDYWKKLGDQYYTYQYDFDKKQHEQVKQIWIDKSKSKFSKKIEI
jgi:tRNA A-37 threonylcarbamoyl transferase component Bud32/nicotinic acid mononucleotide adenylyltransferase